MENLYQHNAICAIFRESENNIYAQCIGSGTFVLINGFPFLITAKHVLEGLNISKGIIISNTYLTTFRLNKITIHNHTMLDFCYIPLSYDFYEETKKYYLFFPIDLFEEIFQKYEKHENDFFTIYGFPESKNKLSNNRLKIAPFVFSTNENTKKYKNYIEERNFYPHELYRTLYFDSTTIFNHHHQKIKPPKTESISGGAVFNNGNKLYFFQIMNLIFYKLHLMVRKIYIFFSIV